MGNYKKDFKTLKAEMDGRTGLHSDNTNLSDEDLHRLRAMGLVELELNHNKIVYIQLTDQGNFFDDFENEKRKEWFALGIKELIVAVISGGIFLLIGLMI